MVDKVGVVGLGTMGAGIAEVFAKAGLSVTGVEVNDDAAKAGDARLAASLDRQLAKGRIDAETREAIAARLTVTTDFAALADVDLVVEAVPEFFDMKRDLFGRLDGICRADAILATNTSSLSVTRIAETTSRPARVIGMHFFNPAPIMKLVEVVTTTHTDEATATTVRELAERLGKTPVVIGDRPGFIANRLLFGYLNQAVRLVEDGVADRDEVDAAMRTAGFPMGPLRLLDVIGLDTSVEILDSIHHNDGRSPRHEAAETLRRLVAEGKVGAKAGAGFYDHAEPPPTVEIDDDRARELVETLLPPHVAEAHAMAESGYATITDIETAMTLGCGYPKGLY